MIQRKNLALCVTAVILVVACAKQQVISSGAGAKRTNNLQTGTRSDAGAEHSGNNSSHTSNKQDDGTVPGDEPIPVEVTANHTATVVPPSPSPGATQHVIAVGDKFTFSITANGSNVGDLKIPIGIAEQLKVVRSEKTASTALVEWEAVSATNNWIHIGYSATSEQGLGEGAIAVFVIDSEGN